MAEITGIDHVLLSMPVGAEDEGRAFYGGVLGLTEVPKPEQIASRGGCWFVSSGRADAGAPSFSIHLGGDPDFVPARKAHVALLVDELDELRAKLEAAGVPTVDDDAPIGVRRFYAFDPFGNRLELIDGRDGGFSDWQRSESDL
jgi:catechol 2,3-dioxygenase-like lactoylglutathione lyase family enzyme